MKESYIDYSMSVIVGRALPDVRDGLKPVHRRVLYAMNGLGLASNKSYKKSARVVGEVLGKYHPHGDSAVYDSMVRMVQPFSLRYPLVDGQGNFGSVDGDSAAAMRYTEVRMDRLAEEMLQDIDKNTVDFAPNFDDTLKEPVVLPSKLPNLLLNGSSGIAVGMATNMPPHNLSEVVDGIVRVIEDPEVKIEELMHIITAPDFPTGGTIYGRQGVVSAYMTGRGSLKIRAKAEIVENDKKSRIIVTEIPYQVNKASLIETIANLVRDKKIEGISDLRDESDRKGMRIVIELKKGAIGEVVLNGLYKHTQMQSSFGVINLALVDGQPKELNLKELLLLFIDHRKEVITKRCQFELDKAENRAHILEGLRKALDNIDAVIKTIKASKSGEEAKKALVSQFSLSEEQSKAILEMRLQRLTALEQEKIDEEYKQLMQQIKWLKDVLANEKKILDIIKQESVELKEKYGDERRTDIVEDAADIDMEDLIAEEDMVVTITAQGYIKRLPVETYKAQKRGGKGIIGMDTKEEDHVEELFVASTHDYLLFFTSRGRVHWLKVYQIPQASRQSRGKAIVNLLPLEPEENVSEAIKVSVFDDRYMLFATRKGLVKKTELKAYSRPRRGGIIAINLRDGDELVDVRLTSGKDDVILATSKGKTIRFNEKDARPLGRASMGVTGIKLKPGDEVVGMAIVDSDSSLLTVTENGYGKRTEFDKYPLQRRAGQGVIDIKTGTRNGTVVGIRTVQPEDELMSITTRGIIIRMPVSGISEIGRNTKGVRVMRLGEGEKIGSIARVLPEEDDELVEKEAEKEKEEKKKPGIKAESTEELEDEAMQGKESIENTIGQED